MRSARRDYHQAIRYVRRNDDMLRKERFLQAMLRGDRHFHTEVKKFKGVGTKYSSTVAGVRDVNEIADTFANEYKILFNSCHYEDNFVSNFLNDISSLLELQNKDDNPTFTQDDIMKALSHISGQKADGAFNLSSV